MLLLLCATTLVLAAAVGGNNLKHPQDVRVYIVDDDFTLKWNRSDESAGNVTFSVEYRIPEMDNWEKLPGCQHIEGLKCNFSSLELNVYEYMHLRIRAEDGNSTSSWRYIPSFVPYTEAYIGPPEVHLEAEDKAIVIHIFRPGKKDDSSIWAMDSSGFLYNLVIWENSSHVEERIQTDHNTKKMYNLMPETTYCLKVNAVLPFQRRAGVYSPVYCINTTAENKLPVPENIKMSAQNQSYILKWDYKYGNVTFQVQYLRNYLKLSPENRSDKWKQIPNCSNVRTTYCVFPQVSLKGYYFIRVQASDGNNTSFWSEEKKINTEIFDAVPPPAINVKSTNDSLRVYIIALKQPLSPSYPHIFEIVFWENTSNSERKIVAEENDVSITNLQPLTVYCVKVRAHSMGDSQNKSSAFTAPVCEKTKPGSSSHIRLVVGICTVLGFVVVICAVVILLRCLRYVFFPSLKPPCNINEYFSEQPLENLLLSTSKEQTERCFIIENTKTVVVVEETVVNEDHKKYSSQSSQDSGNYSIEDETLDSREREELLQQESGSPLVSSALC